MKNSRGKNLVPEWNIIRFILATYIAIILNILSGIILARTIGPEQRGILTYYLNFLLLSSFLSAFNMNNATASTLAKNQLNLKPIKKGDLSLLLAIGFIISFASSLFYFFVSRNSNQINENYFLILMLLNSFSSLIALYEGIWKFNNSIHFLTISRFTGLAIPSLLTIFLVLINKVEIKYLLLGHFFATSTNLFTVYMYYRRTCNVRIPHIGDIVKIGFFGFPSYLIEYLVTWIIPFLILHQDGARTLGWFAVAMSFANLADVSYNALEAKNYRFITSFLKKENQPSLIVLARLAFPIFIMHCIFIPLAFLIPLIYGDSFNNSKNFAIIILLIRFPIILARGINSYLIIHMRNFKSFLIYFAFVLVFFFFMTFGHLYLFTFRWIVAYALAALSMLFCSLFAFYTENRKLH